MHFIRWLKKITAINRIPKNLKLDDLGECLGLVSAKKPYAVLLFFNHWKKEFIADFFPEYNLIYLHKKNYKKHIFHWLLKQNCPLIIWSYKEQENFQRFFKKTSQIIRVEDGFLRSKQLGSLQTQPLTLAIDKTGLYFNSSTASDLEILLNDYVFSSEELERARTIIDLIQRHGISKYNHAPQLNIDLILGAKTKERVLVIGQVERDLSIKYGCSKPFSNNDLVKLAYAENPNAEIIYKIHPDVLAKKQKNRSSINNIKQICTVLTEDIAPCSLFKGVDKVYTITSLMGFEALLYNLPVICVGAPFYSGWGLTKDYQNIPRRKTKRSLEEVFFAAYILYLRYPYGDIYYVINCLKRSQNLTALMGQ